MGVGGVLLMLGGMSRGLWGVEDGLGEVAAWMDFGEMGYMVW